MTRTFLRPSFFAASRPPNPAPIMMTCGFWFCDSFIPESFNNVQLRNDRGQARYPKNARGGQQKAVVKT
jgi:hypothetical protein